MYKLYMYMKLIFFPVMFAAVCKWNCQTGNKIAIGVADTGEQFDASFNDTRQ